MANVQPPAAQPGVPAEVHAQLPRQSQPRDPGLRAIQLLPGSRPVHLRAQPAHHHIPDHIRDPDIVLRRSHRRTDRIVVVTVLACWGGRPRI
jgi:hypothetical protein